MPISLLIRLAWRNLIRNARRSAFGFVTIAVGVFGLSMAGGFIEDVFEQLGEATISAQSGHLQIALEGYWEGGAGRPEDYLIAQPNELKSAIAADGRVAEVMGRLSFSALLSANNLELAVEGEGVEPWPEGRLGARLALLQGRNLAADDGVAAALGEGVAKHLGVGAGDFVTITAPTLDGAMNLLELEVVGVFRSFSKEFDDRTVRLPLPVAHELVQADSVNTIVVQLKDTGQTTEVLHAVAARLDGRGLEVEPWYRLSDFYANTEQLYARQFGFLKVIALVLVVMSVVNSLNMTVFERMAEFGTMRVLGNRRRDVGRLIVIEAALLGLLGALAGVLLSIVGGAVVSSVGIPMPPPPNMEAGYTARILLTPRVLFEATAIGAISSLLAALLPAWRAGRVPLAEALRRAV